MNGDGNSNDGIMHNGFKHYLGSLQEKSLFTKAICFFVGLKSENVKTFIVLG